MTKKAKKAKQGSRTAPARLVALKKAPKGKKRVAEDVSPSVPEPGTLSLMGLGGLGCGLAFLRRRRKHATK